MALTKEKIITLKTRPITRESTVSYVKQLGEKATYWELENQDNGSLEHGKSMMDLWNTENQ